MTGTMRVICIFKFILICLNVTFYVITFPICKCESLWCWDLTLDLVLIAEFYHASRLSDVCSSSPKRRRNSSLRLPGNITLGGTSPGQRDQSVTRSAERDETIRSRYPVNGCHEQVCLSLTHYCST